MVFEGVLKKMDTVLDAEVNYFLFKDTGLLHMNQLINRKINLKHVGYCCLNCNKEKKIYRQGFCYECFTTSPAVGNWIMHPELSTAHLGIEDRDLEYEKRVQLQPHIVYFAAASDVKVGVTRHSQMPTRWIDQGAHLAIPIVEVPNRYLAGITEVALKTCFADKTNWRKMLQNEIVSLDTDTLLQEVEKLLPNEVLPYYESTVRKVVKINYPVLQYPAKVNSLSFEKTQQIGGVLKGIKGQYLIFEDGGVFNIRTFEGYRTQLTIE